MTRDGGPAGRILVVDDTADVSEVARLMLQGAGYEVSTAGSGPEALVLAASSPPDLVLLDINMPVMDGWEVLRALRADERTRAVPVAMFTVRGEIRDKVHALQEGATDFITKPFSQDELLDHVRRILADLEVRP